MVTKHGEFTENKELGLSEEEVYRRWLENKGKESVLEITLQERNRADIDYLAIMQGVDLV